MKKLTKFTLLFLSLISFSLIAQSNPEELKTDKESVKKELKTAIEKLDASINKINQGMPTASSASKAKLITLKNNFMLKKLNLQAYTSKVDSIEVPEWPNVKMEIQEVMKEIEKYYKIELPESR